jgi:hypothetical protein
MAWGSSWCRDNPCSTGASASVSPAQCAMPAASSRVSAGIGGWGYEYHQCRDLLVAMGPDRHHPIRARALFTRPAPPARPVVAGPTRGCHVGNVWKPRSGGTRGKRGHEGLPRCPEGQVLAEFISFRGGESGSIPLGSANVFNYLTEVPKVVSNTCPIYRYERRWLD